MNRCYHCEHRKPIGRVDGYFDSSGKPQEITGWARRVVFYGAPFYADLQRVTGKLARPEQLAIVWRHNSGLVVTFHHCPLRPPSQTFVMTTNGLAPGTSKEREMFIALIERVTALEALRVEERGRGGKDGHKQNVEITQHELSRTIRERLRRGQSVKLNDVALATDLTERQVRYAYKMAGYVKWLDLINDVKQRGQ